jgi:hypothetical protein
MENFIYINMGFGDFKLGFDTKYYPELEEEWLYREIEKITDIERK